MAFAVVHDRNPDRLARCRQPVFADHLVESFLARRCQREVVRIDGLIEGGPRDGGLSVGACDDLALVGGLEFKLFQMDSATRDFLLL